MPTATIDQVIAEAKALPLDKQKQLRDTLNSWLAQPQMTEAEFEQKLLRQGFMSNVPPPIVDFSNYRNRQPIQVAGKPLSETIIEDRGE